MAKKDNNESKKVSKRVEDFLKEISDGKLIKVEVLLNANLYHEFKRLAEKHDMTVDDAFNQFMMNMIQEFRISIDGLR